MRWPATASATSPTTTRRSSPDSPRRRWSIGHSFGGLIAQRLHGMGFSRACVVALPGAVQGQPRPAADAAAHRLAGALPPRPPEEGLVAHRRQLRPDLRQRRPPRRVRRVVRHLRHPLACPAALPGERGQLRAAQRGLGRHPTRARPGAADRRRPGPDGARGHRPRRLPDPVPQPRRHRAEGLPRPRALDGCGRGLAGDRRHRPGVPHPPRRRDGRPASSRPDHVRSPRPAGGASHAHHHDRRRHRDLLQGLGDRSADRLQPRLAAVGRRLGRPDDVLPGARLPRHRPRPSGTRALQPDLRRPRHGPLRRRPGRADRAPGPARRRPRRPLDRRWRGRPLPGPPRRGAGWRRRC